ncbi:hypothetical protein [Sinomonas sp. ASV322]|uniref:hypothetical protein n=1 Tax=Sinomonas sp. ASV322 TaxID=3041920 RepID=UPI0027DCC1D7|nr:hypothetical protein [Sinomonas sp. ASV322]MDQ4501308.1 hypothetical protein [Sinomonas sp. ASV322]
MSYMIRFSIVEDRMDRMDQALYLELIKMTATEKQYLAAGAMAGLMSVGVAINAYRWHQKVQAGIRAGKRNWNALLVTVIVMTAASFLWSSFGGPLAYLGWFAGTAGLIGSAVILSTRDRMAET